MLIIRLARTGQKNLPFFRIVLTDHKKPVKSGYKEVLGWYNPIKHEYQLDVDQLKQYISHGTQLSERVAKLAYARSKDEVFKKFFEISNVQKPSKKK
ncbi:MAG: 30S ribosomal protein S16 [Candidatus Absconditabacterales bacterium]